MALTDPVRHADREHSEFGGSSAERAVHCTGSVFLKRQLPQLPGGPDAERGTAIHEYFSELLAAVLEYKVSGTPFSQADILARLIKDPRIEPDKLEECQDLIAQAIEDIWVKGFGQSVTNKVYGIEERFEYDEEHNSGGITDVWWSYIDDRTRRVLAVYDLKTGRTPAEPKDGQIPFYACAIRKYIRAHGKDIDLVRAIIYQPRDYSAPDAWKEATLTSKQLDAWDKKFFTAEHQIYVLKKPRFKVGSWCTFCPAQAHCKAYRKEHDKHTALKLADAEATLPEIDMLSADQRLALALNRTKIEKYLKTVYASVLNDALQGQEFPGVKVVLANSKRRWINDEAKIEQTLLALGVDDIWIKKLKPFGPLERKLGEKALQGLLEKPPGKPMLVSATDERPAVSGGAALLDFDLEE